MTQHYVSSELTHLVGQGLATEEQQYCLLIKILNSGWLTYPPHVHGNANETAIWAKVIGLPISSNMKYMPISVCFCDIPVSDLGLHVRKYSHFGLSFHKSFLVENGANPVFYIAENSAVTYLGDGNRKELLDKLHQRWETDLAKLKTVRNQQVEHTEVYAILDRVLSDARKFEVQVFPFFKFFDSNKAEDDPCNYYMEREWRIIGNLQFALADVRRVLLPESYSRRFLEDVPSYFGQLTYVE